MPQKLVSPGYFDVYEIGLVSGRQFTEAEASGGAPVVILSEQAAATLWPGQNAVGRLVRLASDSRVPDAYKPPSPVVEVVGVARTVFTSWDQAMRATIYSPMSVAGSNLNMLVKTRGGNVSAALRRIDADLSATAPGVAEQIITAQDLVETRVYPFQAMSWAAGVIGGIALVLTISGIYSVLAYAVARRTKDRHSHGARRERRRGRRPDPEAVDAAVRDWPGHRPDAGGRSIDGAGVHPRDDEYVRRDRVFGRDRHRHRGVSGRGVLPRAEGGGGGTLGGAENRIAAS
jgi:hypothetical protein